MTMIIYYILQRVATTCNYSAKTSSNFYHTYHNFVRFAIVKSRIPFSQFVLDSPFTVAIWYYYPRYKKALSEEGFVTHPLRGQVLSLELYFIFDLSNVLCTRRCFQSFKRAFWSFLETRQILNLNSQVLSNVTHDLIFSDR